MISHSDINEIVTDTLKSIGMYSDEALALLIGTGAVESGYKYLKQIKGPARSYWQIEPATAIDNLDNYLSYRPELLNKVAKASMIPYQILDEINLKIMETLLTCNIAFAICMARIKYYRVPKPLPASGDLEGQAKYWLKYYNAGGKGTIDKFMDHTVKYYDSV
jgi:hypothetical protein|tara:strand:- start:982 stop:1470 length:489 start_codon:yes stop_codon:yes gene_type:complete